MKEVVIYEDENGNRPYEKWFQKLKDNRAKYRIVVRLAQVAEGYFGDVKSVGQGVKELRFFFGPGYRIYFAEKGNTIVLLLCGGDKGSQRRDIQLAQTYWQEYQDCD